MNPILHGAIVLAALAGFLTVWTGLLIYAADHTQKPAPQTGRRIK